MDLYTNPFSSQRMPVLAANGAVATSQPLAAQAGLRLLQQGGSAVDAAVATAASLTVLEPTSNGLGGDAFALVWDGTELHGLNGSGRAPAALHAGELQAQGRRTMPAEGWLPVTVPGAIDAWRELHRRFGRLPLEQVLTPALSYAQAGFPVSPVVARNWAAAVERFLPLADPALAHWATVFAPGGQAPRAGQRWASPAHAATLQRLIDHGLRDFYEGDLARKITAFAQATGGLLSAEDLAAHHSQWVQPIQTRYRDYEVWEIPPNGQGLAALIALALLEGFDLAAYPSGGDQTLHWQIEAMKLAFADAARYIADPEQTAVPVSGLLDPAYLAARRRLIGRQARLPEPGQPAGHGTVYLCAADREGMMVSFIQSNYQGFGSGVVVPETGIALHNRGLGFSLEPGHPNEVAGGKRPYHTIIPAFLTQGGRPVGPFGVMGAYMQPQGHLQVVVNTVDYGLNPQAALDAPRWRIMESQEGQGLLVSFERETPEHVLQQLAARGHQLQIPVERGLFGRGQIIWRLDEGVYAAGSDKRADGAAVGY